MNGDGSSRSAGKEEIPRHRLRRSGGYRDLRDFHVATLIYDATVLFCERFVDRRSRTVDQMVQAARSGRQNIAEGSRASAASSQVELRLVNTARVSLEELLLDYEDYLDSISTELGRKRIPKPKSSAGSDVNAIQSLGPIQRVRVGWMPQIERTGIYMLRGWSTKIPRSSPTR